MFTMSALAKSSLGPIASQKSISLTNASGWVTDLASRRKQRTFIIPGKHPRHDAMYRNLSFTARASSFRDDSRVDGRKWESPIACVERKEDSGANPQRRGC